MAISHVFSNAISDGTNTNIVRPSDWNSAHNQYYTLSGNTLGNSTVSGTNVVFQGSGNVSLSGTGSTIIVYGTGGGGGGVAVSAGTQSVSTGTVNFADSNGITFGMSGSSQITASFSQSVQTQASGNIVGAGFTTATTAGTAIVGTHDSLGLSLGVPAYLTTQSVQTQAAGNIAGTGFTSATTAGSVITGALGTNGLNLGIPAYLTTQSVQTQASGNIVGAGFTTATTAGTAIVGTHDSLGLSLGVPAYLTTQSVQTQAAGNIAGTGFTSATTAGSVITAALGTNGLNMGIPAYLTAAAGGVMYANLSGNTSGNTTASGSTLNFSGINLTLSGTNNSQIAISAPATSSLVAGANITISTAGSTISIIGVAPQHTLSGYNHYNDVVQSIGAVGQGSLIFSPIDLANAVQFDRFGLMMFNSNSNNSSGSHTVSFWIGLYTRSISTLSLFQSTSTTIAVTHSGTVGSYSLYSGVRQLTIPFTTTLSANAYWLGVVSSTASAGANGSYSQLQQSNLNSDYRGLWGSAVNATNQIYVGQGLYTATTAGLPGSVAFSQINGTAAVAFRPPVVIFQSGTV